jgi:hypothetical protein
VGDRRKWKDFVDILCSWWNFGHYYLLLLKGDLTNKGIKSSYTI